MTELEKYKKAFSVACELLNGDCLFGIDAETISKEMVEKNGIVSCFQYEEYILSNLEKLAGEEEYN